MSIEDHTEHANILRTTFLNAAIDGNLRLQQMLTSSTSLPPIGSLMRFYMSLLRCVDSLGIEFVRPICCKVANYAMALRCYPEEAQPNALALLDQASQLIGKMLIVVRDGDEDHQQFDNLEIEKRLEELLREIVDPQNTTMFGEVLVKQGKATPEQIEAALHRQKSDRNKKLGDYLIEDGVASRPDVERAISLQEQRNRKSRVGKSQGRTLLKIDGKRIDDVMGLVGELVVIKSLLIQSHETQQSSSDQTSSNMSLLDRTVRDLYDRALALRMTSLQELFGKMQRTVVDLSAKLGKPVDFFSSGNTTELDRAIIDQLNHPLVHICRNAIDHGLESAEVRRRSGKPEVGKIKISAANEGGNVIITVSDDGAGIDKERVFQKAQANGLISSEAVIGNFTDEQVFDFLFEPGFSTADKVTDISGRGVGMDVVKDSITTLKGHIKIDSVLGQGSRIHLVMPVTTAITDGILVKAGGETYILPIEVIREFVQLHSIQVTPVENGAEMIELRGLFIPLIRVARVLNDMEDDDGLIVIVETKRGSIGLLVSEVLGQSQVVLKNLEESVGESAGISGAAIMGDGRVGLVLDVNSMCKLGDLYEASV